MSWSSHLTPNVSKASPAQGNASDGQPTEQCKLVTSSKKRIDIFKYSNRNLNLLF